jgi:hypothetical protein
MSNEKRNAIIASILVGVIALFFIFNYFSKEINWEKDYEDNKRMAYGTSLIKKLIKKQHPKAFQEVEGELNKYFKKLKKGKKYNYVFIGKNILLNPKEIIALDSFAKAGNTAFISAIDFESFDSLILGNKWENPINEFVEGASQSENLTEELDTKNPILKMLFSSNNGATLTKSRKKINYNLTHPDLAAKKDYVLYNIYKTDTIHYLETNFFSKEYFKRFDDKIIDAGYVFNPHQPNFLIIPWGKGQIIFHCGPEFFSNIALKDSNRVDYAEKVLSHLNAGTIIFDEIHKTTFYELDENGVSTLDKSQLSYILSQRSLRWAWYTSLIATLLFVIFGAKRKQAPIPIILPTKNTSLEYVKTIGQLYFLDKNHILLAKEIKAQFYNFVKNKYQLSLNIDEEEKFIHQLHLKAEIEKAEIEDIILKINKYANENQMPLEEKKLHELYQITDKFYKNCK